jgi:hypothetical protein
MNDELQAGQCMILPRSSCQDIGHLDRDARLHGFQALVEVIDIESDVALQVGNRGSAAGNLLLEIRVAELMINGRESISAEA